MNSLDYTSYINNLLPGTNARNGTAIQSSQFLYLLDFLNSSRAGTAQKEYGISFETFITSLTLSLIYCLYQACAFSLIREHFKNIYQPNCYYVPDDEKIPPLKNNLFAWLTHSIFSPLDEYKKISLDAYLFLRFISFVLILFFGLAIFNLPVLLPVNYLSGYDKYTELDFLTLTNGTIPLVQGLDRLSMTNISPKFSNRFSIHLTMTIISILWFHGLIIYELATFIRIKNDWLVNNSSYLISKLSERNHLNTILIDNVPTKFLDKKELNKLFSNISGAKIKNIWLVYNYKDLKLLYKNHLELINKIEYLETELIFRKFFIEKRKSNDFQSTALRKNEWKCYLRGFINYKIQFKYKVLPTLNYFNSQDQLIPITNEFIHNYYTLQTKRNRLALKESSPLNDHKYNKVFIQFENPLHPDILNQIQISNKLNYLDKTLIRVNPKDIIWENLSIESNMFVFVRVLIGNFLSCLTVMLWVIPVSFVTMISQVPYLSRLIPFLGWLRLLPDYITDVISNLLSVIFLLCLMEFAPFIMRFLSYIKCKRTGAEIELDVQKWMFVFLFIHIFMVVTLTSGFTIIIESLLHNPISIPDILANNLPKCANFFFSYLIVRGISYFGNNLLQNYKLFMSLFVYKFIDVTPREKFNRLINIPTYKWGSLYPSFTLLASIGLIYSILSPLIIIFVLISFSMALISFKYSIKFQFSYKNYSETYGEFYPNALFHLYTGIYFLEICLIGIFASAKDKNNEFNCLYHALITFILLILTITGQIQLKKMFKNLLTKNLPLNLHKLQDIKLNEEDNKRIESPIKQNTLFNDTFYEECFQHNQNIIWLPNDKFNISNQEIEYLKNLGINASNEFNKLNEDGDIEINNCPPDFIDW